jgi:SnoaL-like domain
MSEPDPSVQLALRTLAERYARGVDRRDRELFVSAFHPDARIMVFNPSESEQPRVMTGLEEIGRVTTLIQRYDRTYHFLGNSFYDVEGDTATGEVYCQANHLTPGSQGGLDYVMMIRYSDRYRLADGAWKIDERKVLIDWTELRIANALGQ